MRCPEECGGALVGVHFQQYTDGSGWVINAQCNKCSSYFSKAISSEDFERD